MNLDLSIIIGIVTLVATAAAAWGAAKVALNGAKQNITILREKFEAHQLEEFNRDASIVERLIRVELLLAQVLDNHRKSNGSTLAS